MASGMSTTRNSNDRRRRVLYATHHDDSGSSTAAGRREAERLRAARRPTAIYGERVQRRLQSKWFSLVPINRGTAVTVASAFTGLTILLILLHYLSVTWPRLAFNPEIARPLRLDHADSFGRWYLSMLLAASSGAAFLIYQLRRYRLDDYRGQYRLWRTMLLTLAFTSVGVTVSLVDWSGSMIDAALGRRAALAGADWVRLLVSMGGMVLVLRLIAETYRSRFSLVALLVAVAALVFPEAAGWNLFAIDSPIKWSAMTSAPLVGSTAIFLSLGAYLRLLYREVCEIEASPSIRVKLSEQFSNLKFLPARRDRDDSIQEEKPEPPRRQPKAKVVKAESAKANEAEAESDPPVSAEPKTRWWHRKKKQTAEVVESETETESTAQPERITSSANEPTRSKSKTIETPTDEPTAAEPKKRRFGLGGLLKRKARDDQSSEDPADDNTADENSSENTAAESRSQSAATESPAAEARSSEDALDPDSIDWDSLSKAERRKLRKQLKRQNRAA